MAKELIFFLMGISILVNIKKENLKVKVNILGKIAHFTLESSEMD